MIDTPLTPEEGQRLLQLARDSVVAAVMGKEPPAFMPGELSAGMTIPYGAFVTLYRDAELRGCIGRMQYDRPVYLNVIDAAASSALEDPRFPSVTAEEVASLRIEVSVLDEPTPIAGPHEYDPDQHGIVMEIGYLHGVFLPKVAREYGWDRSTTLTMLCRKIGMPDDAWKGSQARFKVYRAQEFAEPKV